MEAVACATWWRVCLAFGKEIGFDMSEMKLVFLGTGSARPTPQRNTAAVALLYGPDALLFDCGEGTQLQIMKSSVRASRFRAICLTHFHGDHVNGLPGLLGTMGLNDRSEELTVVGPRGLPQWFQTLRQLKILAPSFPVDIVEHAEASGASVLRGDGWSLSSAPVVHRVPTVGYRFDEDDLRGRFNLDAARALGVPPGPLFGALQRGESVTLDDGRVILPEAVMGETRRGRKIAYITDTRPDDGVVDFVRGVDVLIHEATYLEEDRAQARQRFHSTARQAAEIAKAAGVGQLILTHFSTKYLRTGPLVREAREIFPATVAASDFFEWSVPVPE